MKNIFKKKEIIIFLSLVLMISFFSPNVFAVEEEVIAVPTVPLISSAPIKKNVILELSPEVLEEINDASTRYANGVPTNEDLNLLAEYDVEIKIADQQGRSLPAVGQPSTNSTSALNQLAISDQFQFYFNIGVALILAIVLILLLHLVFKKS